MTHQSGQATIARWEQQAEYCAQRWASAGIPMLCGSKEKMEPGDFVSIGQFSVLIVREVGREEYERSCGATGMGFEPYDFYYEISSD